MSRVCLFYREPDPDRWLPYDRFPRRLVRGIVRGPLRAGGVRRVFLNLKRGLDLIGVPYVVNPRNADIRPDDLVAALGVGREALRGYRRENRIVAGIALMTRPRDWPTLFDDYPVSIYLQHSDWAAQLYRPYFGDRVGVWPVGIDTQAWAPGRGAKTIDVLLYEKTGEVDPALAKRLIGAIEAELARAGLSYRHVRYGSYRPADYAQALAQARAMVFVSPSESQGLAYQEALASGVPVLAWDPQIVVDAAPGVMVTSSSTPFFDERCGLKFKTVEEFATALDRFWGCVTDETFAPRDFVLDNLTLEKSAAAFMTFLHQANP